MKSEERRVGKECRSGWWTAEDGVRDGRVTGVQTCALPIYVDGAVGAQEVGGVEQVDVQRVALDPLAAVEQPAQRQDLVGHGDAAGVLDRPARAGLVGHRADEIGRASCRERV